MTPNKTVTINFTKPGLQPPVYLAGSFSNPPWIPLPMQYLTGEHNEHQYYKHVEVEEGKEYQYKFRLGEGDWWVLNEDSPIATDDIGNRNNLLTVPAVPKETHIPLGLLGTANMSSLNDGTGDAKPETNVVEPEVKDKATTNEESSTVDPPIGSADDKDSVTAVGDGENHLDITVPIPQPNNGDPDFGHTKEEAVIEDEGTAIGPPILLADETDSVKDVKHEEPDLTGTANPVPQPETHEAEAQHKDEAAIKDEDTTSGHPIVLADGKGDVKAIKDPNSEPHQDHTNRISSSALEGPVGPQQPEDELGGDATVSPGDLLKTPTSEPDYNVISRSEARTPDLARVAADVADSAETLDRDTPTPEVDAEEAGRTGFRRMSSTPIPEVAKTAAEVADSAAIIDNEDDDVENMEAFEDELKPEVKEETQEGDIKEAMHIEIPTPQIIGIDEYEAPGSGTVTPWEERAPRFSHECPIPPPTGSDLRPASREHDEWDGRGPRDPFENSAIDPNDPSIEEFPSDREAIYERVRSCQRHLNEDPTAVEGVPPSPVVGPSGHPERFEFPSPKAITINDQHSPSLLSIQEEAGDGFHKQELTALPRSITQPKSEPDLKEAAAKDERETEIEVLEVSAESTPSGIIEPSIHNHSETQFDGPPISSGPVELPKTPFDVDSSESKQLDSEDGSPQEIISPKEGPSITVQPSTPGTSMKNRGSNTTSDPFDKATKTTAIEENGRAQLTSRKRAPSPIPERPITPSSMRSVGKDAKGKNFLKTFLHLVFVEWIGGLIARLCGEGRNTPLVIIAFLVFIVVPYLYFSQTGYIANRPLPHVQLDGKAGTPSIPPRAE